MRRKKIWEISPNYHCSILGTCLTLKEVETAFLQANWKIPEDCSDYNLHVLAIKGLSEFSRFSNKVNEKLDSKYRAEVFQALGCGGTESFRDYWDKAGGKGRIAGAYWALMSHPSCPQDMLREFFGQIHMLSHLAGADERSSREKINYYDSLIEDLKQKDKTNTAKIIKAEDEIGDQKKEIARLKVLNSKLEKLCRTLREETAPFTKNAAYSQDKSIKVLEDRFGKLARQNEVLESKNLSLTKEVKELKSVNNFLKDLLEISKRKCPGSCTNTCNTERVIDLEKRRVLLVGGPQSLIPACRSLVEIMNGVCAHHDGGQENSRSILQKMVPSADIVVCFVDCVSHIACQCVKKNCRREEQKVIMLRNSGLSTFKRELEKAV